MTHRCRPRCVPCTRRTTLQSPCAVLMRRLVCRSPLATALVCPAALECACVPKGRHPSSSTVSPVVLSRICVPFPVPSAAGLGVGCATSVLLITVCTLLPYLLFESLSFGPSVFRLYHPFFILLVSGCSSDCWVLFLEENSFWLTVTPPHVY